MTATVATIVAASPATAAPTPRARKLAVRNEVALSHHTAVRKDLAQDSASRPKRPTSPRSATGGPQPPHGRPQDSPRSPAQARSPRSATGWSSHDFGKPGPGPIGPQIRGKQSHGKPSGCSSCKGNNPAIAPKARKPVARARPTAVPKVDLSRIVVTGSPPLNRSKPNDRRMNSATDALWVSVAFFMGSPLSLLTIPLWLSQPIKN